MVIGCGLVELGNQVDLAIAAGLHVAVKCVRNIRTYLVRGYCICPAESQTDIIASSEVIGAEAPLITIFSGVG